MLFYYCLQVPDNAVAIFFGILTLMLDRTVSRCLHLLIFGPEVPAGRWEEQGNNRILRNSGNKQGRSKSRNLAAKLKAKLKGELQNDTTKRIGPHTEEISTKGDQ
ncbi:uncharacterized protein LOC104585391 isoform X3 [Brachypodium distachyon]|uniref:uncharacterized protein LOC104585391 isoform X3 n=1 Tax=Brachypodium distachyon TaxID=15368 RepID=UPI000D0CB41B|nr:uncharacterized protein LOC104585391 isoform X3 [Brachypodium distachyon]|eukprot:XP_024311731.1 uncharacterized protein LOC104585391 isoform X3 [Brachypodium distachyon]